MTNFWNVDCGRSSVGKKAMAEVTQFGFGCGIKVKDTEPALEALETNIFWNFKFIYSFYFQASYFIKMKW